jgi:hypothetical protein
MAKKKGGKKWVMTPARAAYYASKSKSKGVRVKGSISEQHSKLRAAGVKATYDKWSNSWKPKASSSDRKSQRKAEIKETRDINRTLNAHIKQWKRGRVK